MTENAKSERVKLTITKVDEPKEIGTKGAQKLGFKAANPDGKELTYFTFAKRLFDHIKPDIDIDVDVETSEREYNDNVYTDRKVIELYENGQAVGKSARPYGGGRAESPEQRTSIERQVSVKCAAELAPVFGNKTIGEVLANAAKIHQFISGSKAIEVPPEAPRSNSGHVKAPDGISDKESANEGQEEVAEETAVDLKWWLNGIKRLGDNRKFSGWLADLGYVVKRGETYGQVIQSMNLEHRAQLATWMENELNKRGE